MPPLLEKIVSVWNTLISECQRLEEIASKIQVTSLDGTPLESNLPTEAINQLIDEYHSWYCDCLSVLPDDLIGKFRLQYEGDGDSITKCIVKFFNAPHKHKKPNGRTRYRGMRVSDIEWLYSYETFFRNPLRMQKQIIIEVSKRQPATLNVASKHDNYQSHVKEKTVGKITALFLAANPRDTGKLMLDEEIRSITEKVYASEYRDYLKIESCWAVRADDLIQSFNKYKPHIVHFSGHGSKSGEILLTNDNQLSEAIDKKTIKALFSVLKDNIQAVILNACYSRSQAEAITEVISCAIGMNTEIGDQAAIIFAASFYRALGFVRSIQEAFDQGKLALQIQKIPEEHIPELLAKEGVDPSRIVLVHDQGFGVYPFCIAGLPNSNCKASS